MWARAATIQGLLLIACACSGSTPASSSPETEQSASNSEGALKGGPIGTRLLRDVSESSDVYEIGSNEGNGLGTFSVRLDGKPVWPPQGVGCDRLVACCTELAGLHDALALSCLLATARDRDCQVAIETSSAIAVEQGHKLPRACAH